MSLSVFKPIYTIVWERGKLIFFTQIYVYLQKIGSSTKKYKWVKKLLYNLKVWTLVLEPPSQANMEEKLAHL